MAPPSEGASAPSGWPSVASCRLNRQLIEGRITAGYSSWPRHDTDAVMINEVELQGTQLTAARLVAYSFNWSVGRWNETVMEWPERPRSNVRGVSEICVCRSTAGKSGGGM